MSYVSLTKSSIVLCAYVVFKEYLLTEFIKTQNNSPILCFFSIVILTKSSLLPDPLLLAKGPDPFFFFCQNLKFLDQGSNPCPLQWKHGVLTTGPPGKSHKPDPLMPTWHCYVRLRWPNVEK